MSPRTLKLALIISVCLNLLVIGAVVGALAFGPGGAGDRDRRSDGTSRGGPPELMAFSRTLDAPQRKELRDRLRSDPVLRGGRERLSGGRDAIINALRAEPFDVEALRQAMIEQRGVQVELATRGIDALVDVINGLNAEDRTAFAAELERRFRWRRQR